MFAARRLMELPKNLDLLLDNEILMESTEADKTIGRYGFRNVRYG